MERISLERKARIKRKGQIEKRDMEKEKERKRKRKRERERRLSLT